MCGGESTPARPPLPQAEKGTNDFPWHLGAIDTHCHPTDMMSSIPSLPTMRTRVLTIMATRSEDQDLVEQVGAQHSFSNRAALATPTVEGSTVTDKIVPAFGWHPWFVHHLYDDTENGNSTYDPALASTEEGKQAQKEKHYSAVLTHKPNAAFIASLPDPKSLSSFLSETRNRLAGNPLALIGEIGIDTMCRLPAEWTKADYFRRNQEITPGGREGRALTKHNVEKSHQVGILKAQLQLAGEMGRAVSIHGVQGHGLLHDTLASLWKGYEKEIPSRRKQKRVAPGAEDFSSSDEESNASEKSDETLAINNNVNDPQYQEHLTHKDDSPQESDDKVEIILDAPKKKHKQKPYKPKPFPPRVCLHSFSGTKEVVAQYLKPEVPAQIFFGFSTGVNLSGPNADKSRMMEEKFVEIIKTVPDDRILIESDWHTAGEDMDYFLEHMYRKVCNIKGWTLEEGVAQIQKNYEEYIFGEGTSSSARA